MHNLCINIDLLRQQAETILLFKKVNMESHQRVFLLLNSFKNLI